MSLNTDKSGDDSSLRELLVPIPPGEDLPIPPGDAGGLGGGGGGGYSAGRHGTYHPSDAESGQQHQAAYGTSASSFDPSTNGGSSAGWRDSTFAVLFLAHLGLMLYLAFGQGLPALLRGGVKVVDIGGGGGSSSSSRGGGTSGDDGGDPVPLLLGILALLVSAGAISLAWVKVLMHFGEELIRVMLLSSVAGLALLSLPFLISGSIVAGVLALVGALLGYVYYCVVRNRIEFAGKNLKVACMAVGDMPGTMCSAALLMMVQIAWCLVWSMAVIGSATTLGKDTVKGTGGTSYDASSCTTYETQGPNLSFGAWCDYSGVCSRCECDGSIVIEDGACTSYSVSGWLYTALLVSLYWGCNVVSNLVHCTTSGAVASWWFVTYADSSPVTGSLRRACTTSLGSVCLAALLTSVVRVLRVLVNQAKRRRRRMGALALAIVECLVGVLERLLEIATRYALCFVAIYGSDFITAGKETAQLFKSRGWTVIVNDDLVDNVLGLGCVVVSLVSALIGYGIGVLADFSSLNTMLLICFGALTGFFLASLVMSVISSALATVLVCFAQDHESFRYTHPNAHAELMQAWTRSHGPAMQACNYHL